MLDTEITIKVSTLVRMAEMGLSSSEQMVVLALMAICQLNGNADPTQKVVQRITGLSRSTVQRTLNSLKRDEIWMEESLGGLPGLVSVRHTLCLKLTKDKTDDHLTAVQSHSEAHSLLSEYGEHREIVEQALDACASTRARGFVADSVRLAMVRKLATYRQDAVVRACSQYVAKGYAKVGKGERYLYGIVRGREKEQVQEQAEREAPSPVKWRDPLSDRTWTRREVEDMALKAKELLGRGQEDVDLMAILDRAQRARPEWFGGDHA
jgi:hypothetical protein